MRSINLKPQDDFIQFYLPSLIFASLMTIPNSWNNSIVAVFVFVFLDIGHAYSTLLRTYLNKSEFAIKPIAIPILFFLTTFIYNILGLPYFWTIIIFYTFFHHMRQNYGIFKWNCYLEGYKNKFDDINIHLFALIPFILFHAKPIKYQALYHLTEYQPIAIKDFFSYGLIIYSLYFFIISFIFLIKLFKKRITQSTFISFVYPSSLNYLCFLIFENSYQTFIPLLVLHATTYVSLINLSEKVISGGKHDSLKVWKKIFLLIFFFSLFEKMFTEYFEIFIDSKEMKGNFFISLIVSLSVLPNLMHYYLDSRIWRKDNIEFRRIISHRQ